jgi:YD repeat-containing protein
MSRTDFPFAGNSDLSFIRTYRTEDNQSRSFGIGSGDSFDIFPVGDSETFSSIDLILAAGGRIHFQRVSRGTSYANAKLLSRAYMGSPLGESTLQWNGNGWDLKTWGGWKYKFPDSGPDRSAQQSALMSVDTGSGALSIQRNAAGALQRAVAPDGSWIQFTRDSKNRVIAAHHSSGHVIEYEYDSGGRLTHIHDSQNGDEYYQYDSFNRLTAVLDPSGGVLLTNTYGSLGELTSQTLADRRTLRYEYGFDEHQKRIEVDFTDDRGYFTRWIQGRGGFYGSLTQPTKK